LVAEVFSFGKREAAGLPEQGTVSTPAYDNLIGISRQGSLHPICGVVLPKSQKGGLLVPLAHVPLTGRILPSTANSRLDVLTISYNTSRLHRTNPAVEAGYFRLPDHTAWNVLEGYVDFRSEGKQEQPGRRGIYRKQCLTVQVISIQMLQIPALVQSLSNCPALRKIYVSYVLRNLKPTVKAFNRKGTPAAPPLVGSK